MKAKRFIEVSFPLKEVSFYSAKEKNIRQGHISLLHIWWARRPLSASRSTVFASLIPATSFEAGNKFYDKYRKKMISILRKEFDNIDDNSSNYELIKYLIISMCKWENTNNKEIIELARSMIIDFNNGVPPKVLDPFGGGGSIPLECLRLGCETYSNDLNPVAVLIQKCTLEYPQKFGNRGKIERDIVEFGLKKKTKLQVDNVLFEDVKYWGNLVFEEAKKELSQYYPLDPDGSIPVGYIWARTIPCQNPACGAEVPLMRQFWLAKKENKKVAVYPYIQNNKVEFKIVGDSYEKWPPGFDASQGTISRAIVKCFICNSITDGKRNKNLFQQSKDKHKLVAVITQKPGTAGKNYRIATNKDLTCFLNTEKNLQEKYLELKNLIGIEPIPNEHTPDGKGRGAERAFSIKNYGLNTWGDLFNSRQKNTCLTFILILRNINQRILTSPLEKEYKFALIAYLSIAFSKMLSFFSTNTTWKIDSQQAINVFVGRSAIQMTWDYFELNPISGISTSWPNSIKVMLDSFRAISLSTPIEKITNVSATSLIQPNNFLDSVFTDPPYYDNIPYSFLADYFYVWHKRLLGEYFPELYTNELSPKKNEIVAYSNIPGGFEAGKIFFEDMLKKSFQEIFRTLKPNGISVIVYAHKSTEGWETLINSLLDSGLIVTSAWPLSTEMEIRLRSNESAALASSIYIVCRKIERQSTALYNEVKEEIKNYLSLKLDHLWDEGISGPDFFIAAIGSSIVVFGKYEKVIDFEGNVIRANKFLSDVRIIVTDFAVKKILHNGFASGISDLTRFYILCRWEFKLAKIPFDEANKLSHSCHLDLSDEWTKKTSYIKKDKEFISILGPQDRNIEDLEGSNELIDVLHLSLKYWEKNRKTELNTLLSVSGFGKSDAFFRVAQAIAETLPQDNKEKKLLEGFLNLREKIISTVSEPKTKYDQGNLEFPENE